MKEDKTKGIKNRRWGKTKQQGEIERFGEGGGEEKKKNIKKHKKEKYET